MYQNYQLQTRLLHQVILVIAATELEIAPCRSITGCKFIVSGMGATNTAIATMSAAIEFKPSLIIQIGIAGAIDHRLNIGDVFFVTDDYQADLGAWRDGCFIPFETPHLSVENRSPLRGVSSRSLNTACLPLVNDGAQIETMEGAALFQAAQACSVRALQIRSVSNYVDSPRSEWQIGRAIAALSGALSEVIDSETQLKVEK